MSGLLVLVACLWHTLPVEWVASILVLLRSIVLPFNTGLHVALDLADGRWRQVWMNQFAVCVIGEAPVWILRDELSAREWARLRRFLRLHTPRTPWGLSISK